MSTAVGRGELEAQLTTYPLSLSPLQAPGLRPGRKIDPDCYEWLHVVLSLVVRVSR